MRLDTHEMHLFLYAPDVNPAHLAGNTMYWAQHLDCVSRLIHNLKLTLLNALLVLELFLDTKINGFMLFVNKSGNYFQNRAPTHFPFYVVLFYGAILEIFCMSLGIGHQITD